MTALRCLSGTGSAATRHATLLALKEAELAATRAVVAFRACPFGDTERLFKLQRAWWAAEEEVERCQAVVDGRRVRFELIQGGNHER